MKKYLKLMRIKHYIKNGLLFVPLIFSKQLLNPNMFLKVLLGFVAFSLIASVVYIINDISDVEKDKQHIEKCKRPIASGEVKISQAYIFSVILLIISLFINYYLIGFKIPGIILIMYLVLNILYSKGFKNEPIIDITILMLGFLFRVLYGAGVVDISISNWLYLTVISMSFYLGIGKRRGEFLSQGNKTREVLKKYPYDFLDKNMYMFLTLSIVFYSLWTIDSITVKNIGDKLIWTIPFVIIICMRYTLNLEKNEKGLGDPVEVVFKDKIILLLITFFMLMMIGLIYII